MVQGLGLPDNDKSAKMLHLALNIMNWNQTSVLTSLPDKTRFLVENLFELGKTRSLLSNPSQYSERIEQNMTFLLSIMG
jgi:hypothetical protein